MFHTNYKNHPVSMMSLAIGLGLLIISTFQTCGGNVNTKADLAYVNGELAKLAPVELKCDLSNLSSADKQVRVRLIEAGRIIDQLFLMQVSPDNPQLQTQLQTSADPKNHPILICSRSCLAPGTGSTTISPLSVKRPNRSAPVFIRKT
jgi:hypothetical protein